MGPLIPFKLNLFIFISISISKLKFDLCAIFYYFHKNSCTRYATKMFYLKIISNTCTQFFDARKKIIGLESLCLPNVTEMKKIDKTFFSIGDAI